MAGEVGAHAREIGAREAPVRAGRRLAESRPDRGVCVVVRRDGQVIAERELMAEPGDHHLVGGDSAHEEDRRVRLVVPGDRRVEVPRHRLAEPAQHLGRQVSLLLGVDHVALREDRAAPGDLGRALARARYAPDLLDLVAEAAGLLIEEGAGPGGAVAVGPVVGDRELARLRIRGEDEHLRGLAADLDEGAGRRGDGLGGRGEGAELVLRGEAGGLRDERGAGPRDAHSVEAPGGDLGEDRRQEIAGRLEGAPPEAPGGRDAHASRPPGDVHPERSRMPEPGGARERRRALLIVSGPQEGGLQADGSYVESEQQHRVRPL